MFTRAADYDRLRGDQGGELFEAIVAEGDLRGRRVLDIGCGTGSFLAYIGDFARAWGVDPSEQMLAVARKKAPGVKLGRAEALPFKDGWFERATMNSVVHLFDRELAFPEARRVLAGDGRLVIRTVDPSFFEAYYLQRYFPSIERIDRARFPGPEELERGLRAAGFGEVRFVPFFRPARLEREWALERIRGRYISTFDHISDEEYAEGVARAERELPEVVEYERRFLIVVAHC